MKKSFLSLLLLVSLSAVAEQHPSLFVKDSDKASILAKIKSQPWAKSSYDALVRNMAPYVERHKSNPEWILSRYMMNWTPGKRYTDFYTSKANGVDSMSGDAPYPTVRVAKYGRDPINKRGVKYDIPKIEELIPYDTSMFMNLRNPDTGNTDRVEPHLYVELINRSINRLAQESATLYWLTGDEAYAKFAADILDQFIRGAWHQNPIHGSRTSGYIGLQTLNDQAYEHLFVAYDFIYPYLKKSGYEMKYYQDVFERFAQTILVNGYNWNNWYAAESCTLVHSALLLEDKAKRDYYLEHFLTKDLDDRGCGHLSISSTVDKFLTKDGHWKEPAGYHIYPVMYLMRACITMENNGYEIFSKYPALFKAASAMMRYVYPNMQVSSFGDSGRVSPSSQLLEMALIFAAKYKPDELPQLLATCDQMAAFGLFNRNKTNDFGLLMYVPQVDNDKGYSYEWSRSGELDFAKFYLQRNGMDKDYGLMYTIQCASYNHNHVNGMSMELFGAGDVMGIDPGSGPFYEHPMHKNYFVQWAAHNTVVADGKSATVPFTGRAATKDVGELTMRAMEPVADAAAISPYVSFTDTRYLDKSTNTNQQRTMALIRTSDKCGYYVDVFRSDNARRNDYMYHNIGDRVDLFCASGEPLAVKNAKIPLVGNDYPGFRFIERTASTRLCSDDVVARFTLDEGSKNNPRYMQAFIAGNSDRSVYTGYSPRSGTAGKQYSKLPVPTLMVNSMSEAWTKPFALVYEPYFGSDGASINKVSKISSGNESDYVELKVEGAGEMTQYIFQGTEPEKSEAYRGNNSSFRGSFGVVSLKADELQYIYLGKGALLSFGDYTIKGSTNNGSISLVFDSKGIKVNSDQPFELTISKSKVSKITLRTKEGTQTLSTTKTASGTTFTLPAVTGGQLQM